MTPCLSESGSTSVTSGHSLLAPWGPGGGWDRAALRMLQKVGSDQIEQKQSREITGLSPDSAEASMEEGRIGGGAAEGNSDTGTLRVEPWARQGRPGQRGLWGPGYLRVVGVSIVVPPAACKEKWQCGHGIPAGQQTGPSQAAYREAV